MAMLVADLREGKKPTAQMNAGKAFAKLMEHAERHLVADPLNGDGIPKATVDGWDFVFQADANLQLPPVRELQAEVLFQTPQGPVTLVGHCDSLEGLTVRDQKLTEKWEAERYVDSLQWRAYLVMFDACQFIYDVFVGRYDSKGAPSVTVTEYHATSFFTYPGIRDDVQRAVDELAGIFARHLPERLRVA